MKNKFSFGLFMTVLLMSLLTSCSKERQLESTNEITQTTAASKGIFVPTNTGIILGRISPSNVKASIMLYDMGNPNVYGPFYPDFVTGQFRIAYLPDGDYKLVISYYLVTSPAGLPSTISIAVTVQSNTITDLGTIYL